MVLIISAAVVLTMLGTAAHAGDLFPYAPGQSRTEGVEEQGPERVYPTTPWDLIASGSMAAGDSASNKLVDFINREAALGSPGARTLAGIAGFSTAPEPRLPVDQARARYPGLKGIDQPLPVSVLDAMEREQEADAYRAALMAGYAPGFGHALLAVVAVMVASVLDPVNDVAFAAFFLVFWGAASLVSKASKDRPAQLGLRRRLHAGPRAAAALSTLGVIAVTAVVVIGKSAAAPPAPKDFPFFPIFIPPGQTAPEGPWALEEQAPSAQPATNPMAGALAPYVPSTPQTILGASTTAFTDKLNDQLDRADLDDAQRAAHDAQWSARDAEITAERAKEEAEAARSTADEAVEAQRKAQQAAEDAARVARTEAIITPDPP